MKGNVETFKGEGSNSSKAEMCAPGLSPVSEETLQASLPVQEQQPQFLPILLSAEGHSTSRRGPFSTGTGHVGEEEDHRVREAATTAPSAAATASPTELLAYRNNAAAPFSGASTAAALLSPAGACSTLSSASTAAASSPLVGNPSSLLFEGSRSPALNCTSRKEAAAAPSRTTLAPLVTLSASSTAATDGQPVAVATWDLRTMLEFLEPSEYPSTPISSTSCRITATGVRLLDSPTAADDAAANLTAGGVLRATAAAAAWSVSTPPLGANPIATAFPTVCAVPLATPPATTMTATIEAHSVGKDTSKRLLHEILPTQQSGEQKGQQQRSDTNYATQSVRSPLQAAEGWIKRIAPTRSFAVSGLSPVQQKAWPSSTSTNVFAPASPAKTGAAAAGFRTVAAPTSHSGSCVMSSSASGTAAATSRGVTLLRASSPMYSTPSCKPSVLPPSASALHSAALSSGPLLRSPALLPCPTATGLYRMLQGEETESGRKQFPLIKEGTASVEQHQGMKKQTASPLAREGPVRVHHKDNDTVVSLSALLLGASRGNSHRSPHDQKRPDLAVKETHSTTGGRSAEGEVSPASSVAGRGPLQTLPRWTAEAAATVGEEAVGEARADAVSENTVAATARTIPEATCVLAPQSVAAVKWRPHNSVPLLERTTAATAATPTGTVADSSTTIAASDPESLRPARNLNLQMVATPDLEESHGQRQICSEDVCSGISSSATCSDSSSISSSSVIYKTGRCPDKSVDRSEQRTGNDGNAESNTAGRSKSSDCNNDSWYTVRQMWAQPSGPALAVGGHTGGSSEILAAAAAQLDSRLYPAVTECNTSRERVDGNLLPAATSAPHMSAPLSHADSIAAETEKNMSERVRRPDFEQQSELWQQLQQKQAYQQGYLGSPQHLQQQRHNQQQQLLRQQQEQFQQQNQGQPFQYLHTQRLQCHTQWQHQHHSIHQCQQQQLASEAQPVAHAFPRQEQRQTYQHELRHTQAPHSLSSSEAPPPSQFSATYHRLHHHAQRPSEQHYDVAQLQHRMHYQQHVQQQHAQDLYIHQHTQSHQRLSQRQPPCAPQPPALHEQQPHLSLQQIHFPNNFKQQQQNLVHQGQQHTQQHQQYHIQQQNLSRHVYQQPHLQNIEQRQQQLQCGSHLHTGNSSWLPRRRQALSMLPSSSDVIQQREETDAYVDVAAAAWISPAANWWQIRKVLSQVESRPLRLSRFEMVEAYAKSTLCLSCDSMEHKITNCPFGEFVCPNCHRSSHRGEHCPLPCRFCFECHAATSVNECIRRTVRQPLERLLGVKMPLDSTLSRSRSNSISANSFPSRIQEGGPLGQPTRQEDIEEGAGSSHSLSSTSALHGSISSSSPYSCFLQHELSGCMKTTSSTWTALEFSARTADRPDTAHGRSVYVANMLPGTSKEALKLAIDLLLDHGCVLAVEMRERTNMQPYAFVELSTLQAAYELVQHKKTALVIQGQPLKVQFKKIGLSSFCTPSSSSSSLSAPSVSLSSSRSCCSCCCPRNSIAQTTAAATTVDQHMLAANADAKAPVASAGQSLQQQHRQERAAGRACTSDTSPVKTEEAGDERNGTQQGTSHTTSGNNSLESTTTEESTILGSSVVTNDSSSRCQTGSTCSCTACGRGGVCRCNAAPYHPAGAVDNRNSCCRSSCCSYAATSATDNILFQLQPFLATGETVLEVCRAVSCKLAQDYGLPAPPPLSLPFLDSGHRGSFHSHSLISAASQQRYFWHTANSSGRRYLQQLPLACPPPGNASFRMTTSSNSSSSIFLKSNHEAFKCTKLAGESGSGTSEQAQIHVEYVEGKHEPQKHQEAQQRVVSGETAQERQIQLSQPKQPEATAHAHEQQQQHTSIKREEIPPGPSPSSGTLLLGNCSDTGNSLVAAGGLLSTRHVSRSPGNSIYSESSAPTAILTSFGAGVTNGHTENKTNIAGATAPAVSTLRAPETSVALLHPEEMSIATVIAATTAATTTTTGPLMVAAAATALPAAAAALFKTQADEEPSMRKREEQDMREEFTKCAKHDGLSGSEVYTNNSLSSNGASLLKQVSTCNVGDSNSRHYDKKEEDQCHKLQQQLAAVQAGQSQEALQRVQPGKQQATVYHASHQCKHPSMSDLQQQHLQHCLIHTNTNSPLGLHYIGSINKITDSNHSRDSCSARPVCRADAPVPPPPPEQEQNAGSWMLSRDVARVLPSSIDGISVAQPFSISASSNLLYNCPSSDTNEPPGQQQQHMLLPPVHLNRQHTRQLDHEVKLKTEPEQTQQWLKHQGEQQQQQQQGSCRQDHELKLQYEQEGQRDVNGRQPQQQQQKQQTEQEPQKLLHVGANLITQGEEDTAVERSSEWSRGELHDFENNVESSLQKKTDSDLVAFNQGQQNSSKIASIEEGLRNIVCLSPATTQVSAVETASSSEESRLAATVTVAPIATQGVPYCCQKATSRTFVVPPPPQAKLPHTGSVCSPPATPDTVSWCTSLPGPSLVAPKGVSSSYPTTAATICSQPQATAAVAVVSDISELSKVAAPAPVGLVGGVAQCFHTQEALQIETPIGWTEQVEFSNAVALPSLVGRASGVTGSAVDSSKPKSSASRTRSVSNAGSRTHRLSSSSSNSTENNRSNRSGETRTTARNRAASIAVSFKSQDQRASTEELSSISCSNKVDSVPSSTAKTWSDPNISGKVALISAFAKVIAAVGKVTKERSSCQPKSCQEKMNQKAMEMTDVQRQLAQQLKYLHEHHSQKQKTNILKKHEPNILPQSQLLQQQGEPQNLQEQSDQQYIQRFSSAELDEGSQHIQADGERPDPTQVQRGCEKEQPVQQQEISKSAKDNTQPTDKNFDASLDMREPEVEISCLQDKQRQQNEKLHSTAQIQRTQSLQIGNPEDEEQIDSFKDVVVTTAPQTKALQETQQHDAQQERLREQQQQQQQQGRHLEQQRQHQQERELLLLKCLQRRHRAQQLLLKEQQRREEESVQQGLSACETGVSNASETGQKRSLVEHQRATLNEDEVFGIAAADWTDECWRPPKEGNQYVLKQAKSAHSAAALQLALLHRGEHPNHKAELVCIRQQTVQQHLMNPGAQQTPPLEQTSVTPTFEKQVQLQNVRHCHSQKNLIGINTTPGASTADDPGVHEEKQQGMKGNGVTVDFQPIPGTNNSLSSEEQQAMCLSHNHSSLLCGVGVAGNRHNFDGCSAFLSKNEDSSSEEKVLVSPQGTAGVRPTITVTDKDETCYFTEKTATLLATSGTLLGESHRLCSGVKQVTDSIRESRSDQYIGPTSDASEDRCSRRVFDFFRGTPGKPSLHESPAKQHSLKTSMGTPEAGNLPTAVSREEEVIVPPGRAGYLGATAAPKPEQGGLLPRSSHVLVGPGRTSTGDPGVKEQTGANAVPADTGHDEVVSQISIDGPQWPDALVPQASTTPFLQQFSCTYTDAAEGDVYKPSSAAAVSCSAAAAPADERTGKWCNFPVSKTSLQHCSLALNNNLASCHLGDTTTASCLLPADETEISVIAEVAALLSSGEEDDERFERRFKCATTHSTTAPSYAPLSSSDSSSIFYGSTTTATLPQAAGSTPEILLLPQLLWGTCDAGNRVPRLENCSSPYNVCPSSRRPTAIHATATASAYLTTGGTTVESTEALRSKAPQATTTATVDMPSLAAAVAVAGEANALLRVSRTGEPLTDVICAAAKAMPPTCPASAKPGAAVCLSTQWPNGTTVGDAVSGLSRPTAATAESSTHKPPLLGSTSTTTKCEEALQQLDYTEPGRTSGSQERFHKQEDVIQRSQDEKQPQPAQDKRSHLHPLHQRETLQQQQASQQEPQQQQQVTSFLTLTAAMLAKKYCPGEKNGVSVTNSSRGSAAESDSPGYLKVAAAITTVVGAKERVVVAAGKSDEAEDSDQGGRRKGTEVKMRSSRKMSSEASNSEASKQRFCGVVKVRSTQTESISSSTCRGRSRDGSLKNISGNVRKDSSTSSGCHNENSRRVGRGRRRGNRAGGGRDSSKLSGEISPLAVQCDSSFRKTDARETSTETVDRLSASGEETLPEKEVAGVDKETITEAEEAEEAGAAAAAAASDKRKNASGCSKRGGTPDLSLTKTAQTETQPSAMADKQQIADEVKEIKITDV